MEIAYNKYMPTSEHKLEQQVSEIAELAKENKQVDVAALMLNALQNHTSNLVPSNQKRSAYFVSIGLPPFGLLYAAKFYFSDYDDGQETAYVCMTLTVVTLGLVFLFGKIFFASSGVSVQQIEQIKPSDVMQLTQ
jgi:hypothetical protein